MKDQLFEPYYKRGFNHLIYKDYMNLEKPQNPVQFFYLGLISFILVISFFVG